MIARLSRSLKLTKCVAACHTAEIDFSKTQGIGPAVYCGANQAVTTRRRTSTEVRQLPTAFCRVYGTVGTSLTDFPCRTQLAPWLEQRGLAQSGRSQHPAQARDLKNRIAKTTIISIATISAILSAAREILPDSFEASLGPLICDLFH
jgi:hypothetical protein